MEKSLDKRKHTRYRVKGRVLAAVSVAGESHLEIGHVQDISEGGLAFICVAEGKKLTGPVELQLKGYELASIFEWRIPSGIVYEENFSIESSDFPQMKRFGVVFENLSAEELELIRCFIRSNLLAKV